MAVRVSGPMDSASLRFLSMILWSWCASSMISAENWLGIGGASWQRSWGVDGLEVDQGRIAS